ncbi:hypothetical protein HMPREF9383_1697 [Streptococcus sanguinis SK150]|uniref:Uncharacterized protein n=1 Tax=Streptococcus sanguinis SK150 TaxID=888811 RepID=F0INJ5_STRSA|nr:hypothetical protein HMPREF9383_1697 [Streptococcus sanguinis SK150]
MVYIFMKIFIFFLFWIAPIFSEKGIKTYLEAQNAVFSLSFITNFS